MKNSLILNLKIKNSFWFLFICLNIIFSNSLNPCLAINNQIKSEKNYEAIVLGKIISKKIKKKDNYYFTEYKLKPKEWFFKKENVEKSKLIIVRILGADFPKQGIVIKSSTAPDYVPIKKDAVFFLEKTRVNHKNIFTITNDGIIYGKDLNSSVISKFKREEFKK